MIVRNSSLVKFELIALLVLISIFSVGILISFGEGRFGFNSGYIPDISVVLIEGISLVIIFRNIKYFDFQGIPKFALLWLIFSLIISTIVTENFDKVLASVTFWPLIFLSFYLIFKSSQLRFDTPLLVWLPLGIICSILVYQISIFKTSLIVNESISATINYIFYPLLLTPWILLHLNRKVVISWLFFILALCLFSVKRSAIVIVVIILFIYFYQIYFKNSNKGIFKKVIGLAIFLFVSWQLYVFVDSLNNNYLTSRIENVVDDQGSGRLDVYTSVFDLQMKSDVASWLIGHGHNAVIRDNLINSDKSGEARHLSAHNDFLEVLYDYGIIGFLIYLGLINFLLRRFVYLRRSGSSLFIPYAASLVIFFIMSFGSHLILYPTYFIYLTSFWGAVEGVIGRSRVQFSSNLLQHDESI